MTRVAPHDLRRPRAGFAAIFAIVLAGLVASILAAVGIAFAADARRTRAATAEAQLRQFLIAGAVEAQQRVARDGPEFRHEQPLPAEGKLSLASTRDGETAAMVVVIATLGPRRAEQTLRFERAGDAWKLARAELRSDAQVAAATAPTSVETNPATPATPPGTPPATSPATSPAPSTTPPAEPPPAD